MRKRVYKFTSTEHGIANLKNRRLKLSTIDNLNDPFDFNSIDTSDPVVARAVWAVVAELKRNFGLVCFSRNWDNLLLWSHYAASHTGLCLGFDIPASLCTDVFYQPNLLKISELLDNPFDLPKQLDFAKKMLSTKHESWSYEQEVRAFVGIDDQPDEKGLLWVPFDPNLQLREVIFGVQCAEQDANNVYQVLEEYPESVECTQAYMRSNAFLLIRSNAKVSLGNRQKH